MDALYHLNSWLTSGFNGIQNEIPYPRDSGICMHKIQAAALFFAFAARLSHFAA